MSNIRLVILCSFCMLERSNIFVMQIFLASLNLVHNKWLKFHYQGCKGREKYDIVRKSKGFAVCNRSPLKAWMSRQASGGHRSPSFIPRCSEIKQVQRQPDRHASLKFCYSLRRDISRTDFAKNNNKKYKSWLLPNIYMFRISDCLHVKKIS